MAHDPNAILAISSTDRYITQIGGRADQPVSNALITQYNGQGPYANDFSITAPNALMNGYIDKIIISQIQLQYYLPTIVPKGNDLFAIYVETAPGSSLYTKYQFQLPYGFFTPAELAAMLQIFLNIQVYENPNIQDFTVTYTQGNLGNVDNVGFTITLDDNGKRVFLPPPDLLAIDGLTSIQIAQILKTYKVFGFALGNANPSTVQISFNTPDFLYTPFIDIYSDALTNYQKLKDTDTAVSRRKGLIARIYLSGVGGPQGTTPQTTTTVNLTTSQTNPVSVGSITGTIVTSKGTALGCEPFILTYDLNSPKVINWSPDTAVNSLDFQQRDCYGDLLFSVIPPPPGQAPEVFNTEFQMTLLCIEGS